MSYALKKNYPRIPVGGWSFPDPSGVTLYGESSAELIDAIVAFRRQNGLPEGAPEKEVTLFYAENFPDFVEMAEETEKEPIKSRSDYVYEWLTKLWRDPPRLIPVKLAANRVKTCEACPFLKAFAPQASEISRLINRKLVVLGQGNADLDLGFCSAYNVHAGLFCLIKDPKVKHVPEVCWINKPDSLIDEG